MKNTVSDILSTLNQLAPLAYQEGYDNSGLLTGSPSMEISNILLSLDCIEEVIDEAIAKKCNVVVCHHPIIFSGLKSLTGANYVERTIIKAIKNDIAIIAWHTNLDNVLHKGVNQKIAEKLHLNKVQILQPRKDTLLKLVVFVPISDFELVSNALYEIGCGKIGNYSNCGFATEGQGTFKPLSDANPTEGENNKLSNVKELRFEVLVPKTLEKKAIEVLNQTHSYEEVAYEIYPIANINQEIGAGVLGVLPAPLSKKDFLGLLKKQFNLSVIKYTDCQQELIETVAICGGSGSFLINAAKAKNADAFVTADIKYHEFFDAESKLMICDIGHYESEISTLEIFSDVLSKKFTNFATLFTHTITNPVKYYI
jgi:dinuclear metal center YbgI/SA1388 family protein